MGYGRSVVWGVVAGLLVVVLAGVGLAVVRPSLRAPTEVAGERLMVVVAAQGAQDEGEVAQLIGVLDMSAGRLDVGLVDPMTTVSVPGTSYNQLRDAYSFGGAAGVSKAYGRATGSDPLPVAAISEDAFVGLVDRLGGVTVTVPADVNVFDGKRLFTFAAGAQHARGRQLVALLSAVAFLPTADEQVALRAAIASGLADRLASAPPDLRELYSSGGVTTTLKRDDAFRVADRLRASLPRLSLSSLSR